MTQISKAHIEFDPMMMGVRIAVVRGDGPIRDVLHWELPTVKRSEKATAGEAPDEKAWLRLGEDDARAIYEALADYFGHAGHDIRALRKDYDAERGRVDKLINGTCEDDTGHCRYPGEMLETGHTWECYIRHDLEVMVHCDGIYMMRGWETSKGATEELRIAQMLGMTVYFQPPITDLVTMLTAQREWSRKTFGPGTRLAGILQHIEKELVEIRDEPHDISEWIDVVILALDGAWRAGAQPVEIVDTLLTKYATNRARTWPDWRTASEDAAIEHLERGD
jgi:hypothetical protein